MKKLKIILCLNLFVLLFIIQGCGKINQKNNTSKTKKSNVNYSLLDKYNENDIINLAELNKILNSDTLLSVYTVIDDKDIISKTEKEISDIPRDNNNIKFVFTYEVDNRSEFEDLAFYNPHYYSIDKNQFKIIRKFQHNSRTKIYLKRVYDSENDEKILKEIYSKNVGDELNINEIKILLKYGRIYSIFNKNYAETSLYNKDYDAVLKLLQNYRKFIIMVNYTEPKDYYIRRYLSKYSSSNDFAIGYLEKESFNE